MNTPFPTFLTVVRAVGRVTFSEIVRDKVLYNIVLCAFLLFALSVLGMRLMFMHQDRLLLDFGLSAVGISSTAIAVFTGSSLLGREFEKRTIFVALSRPISRLSFIGGKYLGLVAVLAVNALLLSLTLLALLGFATSSMQTLMNPALYWALGLAFVQSIVIASISIFFSTFSTTSLSVIMTCGFYLVGTNISGIRLIALKSESEFYRMLLQGVSRVLPNLEHFSLGTRVTYGLPVEWTFGVGAIFYGLLVSGFFLLLSGILVQKREN
ncbi:ABC transporter permease subunit [Bdellovibrionota bacterium FG-2]